MIRPAIAAALALISVGPQPAVAAPIIKADREFYSKGRWIAYAAPWSTYAGVTLRQGIDFADAVEIDPATFPDNTLISHQWPLQSPVAGLIRGYNAVSFNRYDGGTPAAPVAAKQVKSIIALTTAFSLDWFGPIGSFNVLHEFFLTGAAERFDTKRLEVGFFLHAPLETKAYINGGVQLGVFQDRFGRAWQVAHRPGPAGPYCMFVPVDGADMPNSAVDDLGALRFLVAKGLASPEWWFNGLAIGVEPVTGSASLKIISLAVDYR